MNSVESLIEPFSSLVVFLISYLWQYEKARTIALSNAQRNNDGRVGVNVRMYTLLHMHVNVELCNILSLRVCMA